MKWCVLAVALVCGCRGSNDPPQRATGSAGSSAHAKSDPWNVTPTASGPSMAERHARADKLCPAVTGPYFYSIEKAGKVSHILGTRHVSVSLAKFPANVRDALHDAKLAVFEIAPDDPSRPAPHEDIAIDKALGPELWAHYVDLVGPDTANSVQRSRPATALLSMMVEYEDLSSMLDMQIEQEVQQAQIPTGGLETHRFQDGVIETLFDLRMMRATVAQTKDRTRLANDSAKDLTEYCAGTDDSPGTDDETRAELVAGGYTDAEIAAIDDEMVFARNRDWIPKLEKILETDHAFIAVGADHLIGKPGVVALLQARGYTVTRIRP